VLGLGSRARSVVCECCSIEFKRQVAQEFIAGETLHALAKRHDVSRNLIRVWVRKLETGAFDEDAHAADLLQEYKAKIAALERMVGRQRLTAITTARSSRTSPATGSSMARTSERSSAIVNQKLTVRRFPSYRVND
jgi:transposase